ncbi:hypothetical protein [Echinicola sediminis]
MPKLTEAKQFLPRQVAAYIEADTALVSKLERGRERLKRIS